MPSISFQHNQVGALDIDNGIDDVAWGYRLNTATFPTYGGEVVQILSVYIDDVTFKGSVTTYNQMEAIYSYFVSYLQIATQGRNPSPNIGDSVSGTAYNLEPIYVSYPHRDWYFKVYPKNVPGFLLGKMVVAPTWQMSAFVIDDSPDLSLIKEGIQALATAQLIDKSTLTLNGEISPSQGNPDTDPFETYTSSIAHQQQVIQKYAEYYNSLVPAYMQGDFAALTAGIGATPSFGQVSGPANPGTTAIPSPKTGASSGPNKQSATTYAYAGHAHGAA